MTPWTMVMLFKYSALRVQHAVAAFVLKCFSPRGSEHPYEESALTCRACDREKGGGAIGAITETGIKGSNQRNKIL